MYDIFEQLLQQFGVTSYKVSKSTGVTQASLSKWKSGKSTPSSETLQKLANYFGVTVDYLMTGERPEDKEPVLSTKDERDIAAKLNATLEQLESSDGLMFDGIALDDETRELLKLSLDNAIRTAKITAKRKFAPNKYK